MSNVIKFPINDNSLKKLGKQTRPYGGYFFIGISDDFEIIEQWEFSDDTIKEVLKDELLSISCRIDTIFEESE